MLNGDCLLVQLAKPLIEKYILTNYLLTMYIIKIQL